MGTAHAQSRLTLRQAPLGRHCNLKAAALRVLFTKIAARLSANPTRSKPARLVDAVGMKAERPALRYSRAEDQDKSSS
jgi:hypothetical protein